METRQQNIENTRTAIVARQLGNALAAELVDYAFSGGELPHAKEAAAVWPTAYKFFSGVHHGAAVTQFTHDEVQEVLELARLHKTNPEPSPLDTVKEVQAHGRGLGWGHYPIPKEGAKTGCKVTWRVKSGAAVAKRTTIPITKEHAPIVRKCNQLIAEAEQGALYLSQLAPDEWKATKRRWERRQDVRYMAVPQLDGVMVVHNGQIDGAAELGPLCEGYGKAQLYQLVGEWLAARPSTTKKTAKWGLIFACVQGSASRGWGRHYSGAKGKSKNIKANTALALHSVYTASTVAAAVNGTVDENGRGSDMVTSVKAEVETLLQLALVPNLTAEQLDTTNELEAALEEAQALPGHGHAKDFFAKAEPLPITTAAKPYTLTHETGAPIQANRGAYDTTAAKSRIKNRTAAPSPSPSLLSANNGGGASC